MPKQSPRHFQYPHPTYREIEANLSQALRCLKAGEGAAALWRTIDAAGMLVDKIGPHESGIVGVDRYTARGYRIIRR